MPLVSIIIPCYNVAPFMKKCLDAVCAQTLRDIEIICINDGSRDGTLDILREYEAGDERFIVIDQPNAGVAAARNAGLDAASGEYIGFVDPDDCISPRHVPAPSSGGGGVPGGYCLHGRHDCGGHASFRPLEHAQRAAMPGMAL